MRTHACTLKFWPKTIKVVDTQLSWLLTRFEFYFCVTDNRTAAAAIATAQQHNSTTATATATAVAAAAAATTEAIATATAIISTTTSTICLKQHQNIAGRHCSLLVLFFQFPQSKNKTFYSVNGVSPQECRFWVPVQWLEATPESFVALGVFHSSQQTSLSPPVALHEGCNGVTRMNTRIMMHSLAPLIE